MKQLHIAGIKPQSEMKDTCTDHCVNTRLPLNISRVTLERLSLTKDEYFSPRAILTSSLREDIDDLEYLIFL